MTDELAVRRAAKAAKAEQRQRDMDKHPAGSARRDPQEAS